MPRPAWTLFAYQLIEPDEQLDLFACREVKVHLVARQLELGTAVDRTLCGGLLPAHPKWSDLTTVMLSDRRLCRLCKQHLRAQRRLRQPGWTGG